jgi:hypothetical protein
MSNDSSNPNYTPPPNQEAARQVANRDKEQGTYTNTQLWPSTLANDYETQRNSK